MLRDYRRTLATRPSPAARAVQPPPLRPQGCRGRQRRHPGLDHPPPRPRRRRSALPAGEGSPALRARAVPRPQRVRQLRAACRRRPAANASRERSVPRLEARRQGPRRAAARLLHPPTARLERQRRRDCFSTAACAPGRSPGHTRARATGSRSPPISAAATCSTGRSPPFRRRTRIRTSATTPGSPRRSSPDGSKPRSASDHDTREPLGVVPGRSAGTRSIRQPRTLTRRRHRHVLLPNAGACEPIARRPFIAAVVA
jgi:hypothetical protein